MIFLFEEQKYSKIVMVIATIQFCARRFISFQSLSRNVNITDDNLQERLEIEANFLIVLQRL